MVMTPWGDSGALRERRLAPGRGNRKAEVERNQRERLLAAMVAMTAQKGYAATSVGDLVELSGVSSRSFYELYADKEECFLATMEEILSSVQRLTATELDGEGSIEERAERTTRALTETLVAQPAAARLWLVEASSAGEAARQRVNGALWALGQLLQRAMEETPGQSGMPGELSRAILGGVARVVYRRLADGEAEAISDLAPGLRRWALGFPAPPEPLRSRARRRNTKGTGSPPFAAHVPGERILRGFATAVAEKGYTATTIADIAAKAAISQNTFYAHFRDKEAVLFAALDSSGAQMIAATLPAVRRSPEWPGGMRVAAEALCAFFVAEPAFARLREVEVYAAGPSAVRQRDRTGSELVGVLGAVAPGLSAGLDPLVVEATLGALHSMLYEWIRAKGTETLMEMVPLATYLALAPLIGAEQAWETATG
ncbi:MAG TPA: TetR/AcrR family transcriptional regulator [Solirubrobacterales bacterium]|nr:TetR/AcrR family transcriptional regulator [Solirubrobacterales bacterium]